MRSSMSPSILVSILVLLTGAGCANDAAIPVESGVVKTACSELKSVLLTERDPLPQWKLIKVDGASARFRLAWLDALQSFEGINEPTLQGSNARGDLAAVKLEYVMELGERYGVAVDRELRKYIGAHTFRRGTKR